MTTEIKKRIEEQLNKGLAQMNEAQLVRWMTKVVCWWPNTRCRQDMLCIVPSVANALIQLRDQRERKVTLERIKTAGLRWGEWEEMGDCEDPPYEEGVVEPLETEEKLFNDTWELLFCVRAEMIANLCDMSESNQLAQLLLVNCERMPQELKRLASDLVSEWRLKNHRSKSLEDMMMAMEPEYGRQMREKIGVSIKSCKWMPASSLKDNETQWRQIVKTTQVNYANVAVGINKNILGE